MHASGRLSHNKARKKEYIPSLGSPHPSKLIIVPSGMRLNGELGNARDPSIFLSGESDVDVLEYKMNQPMNTVYCPSFIAAHSVADPISVIESSGAVSFHTAPPFFVVGVYEPNNAHGWKMDDEGNLVSFRERGNGTVFIEEQSSEAVVLALGSYEPTDWKIKGPGADNVSEIILFGHHAATISGQNPEVLVHNKTYEAEPGDYISTLYSWESNNRDVIVSELESLSGKSITSFAGAYNAESFHVDAH